LIEQLRQGSLAPGVVARGRCASRRREWISRHDGRTHGVPYRTVSAI